MLNLFSGGLLVTALAIAADNPPPSAPNVTSFTIIELFITVSVNIVCHQGNRSHLMDTLYRSLSLLSVMNPLETS